MLLVRNGKIVLWTLNSSYSSDRYRRKMGVYRKYIIQRLLDIEFMRIFFMKRVVNLGVRLNV